MRPLLCLAYLLVGVPQFLAIQDGLDAWLRQSPLLSLSFALFFACIPFVGSALGMAGAVSVWGWTWWQGGLLFVAGGTGSLAILAGLCMIETIAEDRPAWSDRPEHGARAQHSASPAMTRMTSVWSAPAPSSSRAFSYSAAQAPSPGASASRSRASAAAMRRSFAMSSSANPEA